MRWILDDGPLGHLASLQNLHLQSRWTPGALLVAPTTADVATTKTRQLLDLSQGGKRLIDRFEIMIGGEDPAAEVFFQLHEDPAATTDRAEHESIAWAQVHGEDTVFVCADRRAALTALAELGRARVAHPFDLWIDLRDRAWLTGSEFAALCTLTRKHDQGLPRLPGRVAIEMSSGET